MDGCVFSYNGCRIKRTVSPKEQEKLLEATRVTPLVDAKAVLSSMYLAFADILNELFLLLGFLLFFLEALFSPTHTPYSDTCRSNEPHIARYSP